MKGPSESSESCLTRKACGAAYSRSGCLGEGVSYLQQALTAYESAGIGDLHSVSVEELGEAYLLADRV